MSPHGSVIIMVNGEEVTIELPHDGSGQLATADILTRFLKSDAFNKAFEKFAKHE